MQEQLGMLYAEFIQFISISKVFLYDTLQLELIAQSWNLGRVMQTAVKEALGTRVSAASAHVAYSAKPPPSTPRSRDKDPQLPIMMRTVVSLSSSNNVPKFFGLQILHHGQNKLRIFGIAWIRQRFHS